MGSEAAPPLRPAAIPGPDRVNLGAAGRGGTCRQMSVSSLCQQPGGSVQAQEMLQGGPRTFFFFFLFAEQNWLWWGFSDSSEMWGAEGCWEGAGSGTDTPHLFPLSAQHQPPAALFTLRC